MRRAFKKAVLAVVILVTILVIVGSMGEHHEEGVPPIKEEVEKTVNAKSTPAIGSREESLCPVANTSTSFCIVRNGKAYYFSIEGWELPAVEELREGIPSEGLYVWLKVRTNLNLEFDADNDAYVKVGEQYKPVLFGDPLTPMLRREGDILLLPYRFSPHHSDIESLLEAGTVRLYFDVSGYYDVLPSDGCIGEVCFTLGHHGPGFYMNYTAPPTLLKILDIEGSCINNKLCLYNATFELKGGYLFLRFYFDETTGKKSHADFPIHINIYMKEEKELVHIKGYFPSTVIPPLPSSAIDVWKEPMHEYLTTIIPPGRFTLVFRANGAVYPELLFNGIPVIIGTPWGGVEVSPELELINVRGINGITYSVKLYIKEVNVTLKNNGKIPVVIPQATFPYDIPSNYSLLRGRVDSTDVIFVTQSANGVWDTGAWLLPAVVINPNETVTVPLTLVTIPEKSFGFELSVKTLRHKHVIEVEAPSGSYTIVIPPLKPKILLVNATNIYIKGDSARLTIWLNITNSWVAPINIQWLELYFDNKALDSFYYIVPYEEVSPNHSKIIDMRVELNEDSLYKTLLHYEYLKVCLGATCLKIPFMSLAYRVGDEVSVGDVSLRILNITVVKAIGVRYHSILEEGTVVDVYRAPKGYKILLVFLEVKNRGMKSVFLSSINVDNSLIVTKKGVFELTYLSELVSIENLEPEIVVDKKHLWEEVDCKLKPGEKTTVVLLFIVPEEAKPEYIIIEYSLHKVLFASPQSR